MLIFFLNNNKILCIPPSINNNKLDTDFKEKKNDLIHSLQSNKPLMKLEAPYLLNFFVK